MQPNWLQVARRREGWNEEKLTWRKSFNCDQEV
jgi:hypothetical protein